MQTYNVLILGHHSCMARGQENSSFFRGSAHHGFPLRFSVITTCMPLLPFHCMVLGMLPLPTHEETTYKLAAMSQRQVGTSEDSKLEGSLQRMPCAFRKCTALLRTRKAMWDNLLASLLHSK